MLALALGGCASEDKLEPAAFGEVCGAQGPVRVIAMQPDEELRSLSVLDGRLYYAIAPRTDDPDAPRTDTLWTSGLCGEDPRPIAEGVRFVFAVDLWPDVLLGCREGDREIVSLDPAGERPPNLVFTTSCTAFSYGRDPPPHGIVSREGEDEEPATLLLHPYPDDPRTERSEPIVLLDPTSTPQYPISGRSSVRVAGDEALVHVTDGTLVRVSLPDGAVTVEQTGVYSFALSRDGRWLLHDLMPASGEPEPPPSPVFLTDRTTGVSTSLAQTWLYHNLNALYWADRGVAMLTLPNDVTRLYFLPGLDFADLPPGLAPQLLLPDGRWLLQDSQPHIRGTSLHVIDPRAPESLTLLFRGGNLVAVQPDGVIVVEAAPCCSASYLTDEGKLWFAPFDGRTPSRLAARASNFSRLRADGRLLTTVDLDDAGLGELLLVDLTTGREQSVDRRVMRNSFAAAEGHDEDVLRYLVDDGERSGVWLARIEAQE